MKTSYIVIPLIVLAVALLGSFFTSSGMDWYATIALPDWTPSGSVIGTVWTVLFILGALSAIIFWNSYPRDKWHRLGTELFILNAILNVGWSLVFFRLHYIGIAVFVAAFLGLSVLFLIALLRPVKKKATVLLYPYLAWVIFATYLNYQVWILN